MIYSFICTRDFNPTLNSLLPYLETVGAEIKLIKGAESIFNGYIKAFNKVNPADNDIIILCHDDIEIHNSPNYFRAVLLNTFKNKEVGFAGVAGTTYLGEDAVWWNHERWKRGMHSGFVYHGSDIYTASFTYYGPFRPVVVLDGLFLVSTGKVLKEISLHQPSYFEGNWDFYDLYYTLQSHLKGFQNVTIPITLMHNSKGELAGRESWMKNREAFIKHFSLPVGV